MFFPTSIIKTFSQLICKASAKIKTRLNYFMDIKTQKYIVLHIKNPEIYKGQDSYLRLGRNWA